VGTTSALEVADVVRAFGPAYRERHRGALPAHHLRALWAIERCRTAALGGHLYACDRCGRREPRYHSCRNRHCPKCQGAAAHRWLEARRRELLAVPHFHVVFTLPQPLRPLALRNQRVLYGLLFHAAAAALLEAAANPQHLGAQIGLVAVLHTWGQTLIDHPHLHCLVPGGGLASGGERWVGCRRGFLLPVRVLSRLFRGKYLAGLGAAYDAGELIFPGDIAPLASRPAFDTLLARLGSGDWVVYSQPPIGGAEQVLAYLARYTHRVALSNRRLLRIEGERVVFTYKDYAGGGRRREMTLPGEEFLRRLLLHVLPPGFVRIRSYGLLAHRGRRRQLARCRRLIPATADPPPPTEPAAGGEPSLAPAPTCSVCGQGRLQRIAELPPLLRRRHQPLARSPP
jgi:hypothetical protein